MEDSFSDGDLLPAGSEVGSWRVVVGVEARPRRSKELKSAVVAVAGVGLPVAAGLTQSQGVPIEAGVNGSDWVPWEVSATCHRAGAHVAVAVGPHLPRHHSRHRRRTRNTSGDEPCRGLPATYYGGQHPQQQDSNKDQEERLHEATAVVFAILSSTSA